MTTPEIFDASDFWKDSDRGREKYVDVPPTDEVVKEVEEALGYKLPQAYVDLCRTQNGGLPKNTSHPMSVPTSWAEDHIAITGIYSIGSTKLYSLMGSTFNSKFWEEEWGYPAIGVYFADCPSAGHDMIALDFRSCGANGEPSVVHVDQECDYDITKVAESFDEFIRGLRSDEEFDNEEDA